MFVIKHLTTIKITIAQVPKWQCMWLEMHKQMVSGGQENNTTASPNPGVRQP